MTLLNTFPPNPNYRGPDMAVFRLFPIQRKLDGTLGPIRILGYDLDRNVVRPGGSITFTLYWQAVSPPDADYTVFNHFVKAKETTITANDVVAQIDGPPL